MASVEHDRKEALKAYRDRSEDLLPESNQFKPMIQFHVWGMHKNDFRYHREYCPVCEKILQKEKGQ